MRILAVVSEPPWPPSSGYRIRCWELLSRLAARHEVHLVGFDRSGPGEWAKRFASVSLVPRRAASARSIVASLASCVPHHAALHDTPALRRALAQRAGSCDVALAHYLYFARPVLETVRLPVVLDQHNMDHETWESHAEAAAAPLSWWLRRQARLVRADERWALPRFARVACVSERDARACASLGARAEVVANGADCSRVTPRTHEGKGTRVLFCGTSARRNVEGLSWFVRQAWPSVRARVKDAELRVAGTLGPKDLPRDVARAVGVSFSGPLDDMRPELSRADVAIVPVRLGGGTKLKAFEAMSAGLPVVAWPAATDDCCGERHGVACRGDATSYAEAVASWLLDGPLRQRLGAAAREHAEKSHDWPWLAEREERILRAAVHSQTAPGDPHRPGSAIDGHGPHD